MEPTDRTAPRPPVAPPPYQGWQSYQDQIGYGAPDPQGPPWRGRGRGVGPMSANRGTGTALMVLGLVVAVLVGVLGGYLLVSGHVVVGGLLLAIAVLRVVMTSLRWHRRRERQQQIEAWRSARRGRWGNPA